ncbi:MAG: hypothetical protein MUF54_14070 [Polyangiaceae bacterium]|nr:hypothetical protein [Polyangiaceae bacterium]
MTGHLSNNLVPNGQLTLGQYLQSSDGSHRFTLQSDGNLVIHRTSDKVVLWASGTSGKSATRFKFQSDGNLVLRTASGTSVWSSKTAGSGATQLHMHSAGTLVLYKNSTVVWSANGSPVDQCPNDPNKTVPGLCGCGVPEGTCSGGAINCVLNPYSGVDWSTWKQYKANFHTHTTESDGVDGRTVTINQYADAEYDILAITDHDKATWPWPVDPTSVDMLAVRGDEYSKSEHMNAFFNFTKTSSTLQDGAPHVASQGGDCQINHPGRDHSASEWSWFIPWFRDYKCFGLEVYNQGDRYSNDRRLWDNINDNYFKANGRLVWGTSNDDKHDSGDLYRNFQFMLMPSRSTSNLQKSMRSGTFYFAYEPGGSGDAKVPRISNIVVDNSAKTITITATGVNSIYWVGPGTSTVATGKTFNFSSYTKRFVRAVLDGSSGDSFTQPFGFKSN